MPTITATKQRVYLHCRNARCSGHVQEEVDGVREERSQTFGDNGGDGPFFSMVERSMVHYRVVDEDGGDDQDVLRCPGCGVNRDVSGEPRPQYQNLSGHDPMGLVGGASFDPTVNIPAGEDKTAELQAQLERQQAQIDALLKAKGD